MTVLDTAVGLTRGDRVDGPPRAQLLLVCEAIGDEGTRRRLNAAAIDSVTRELLRDDDWIAAIGKVNENTVTDTLAGAVRTTSAGLAAFKPGDTSTAEEPVLALTLALVAWPFVAVAHAGDSAVVHLADKRIVLPMQTPSTTVEGLGGELPPDVEAWSALLSDQDALILVTSSIRHGVFSLPDPLGEELAGIATARGIVDHLFGKVAEPAEAAIAVAKLSAGVAGHMQAIAEREAAPPAAQHGVTPKAPPANPDFAPLVKDEAAN